MILKIADTMTQARLPRLRRPDPSWLLAVALLLPSLWAVEASVPAVHGNIWILVDTEQLTLQVFQGEHPVLRLDRISIGRGGAAPDRIRGDQQTPIGRYRVVRLNAHSSFHFFIGLDYPSHEQVERAFHKGILNAGEYGRLLHAFRTGQTPPQDSPLGGQIGIHGLGGANRSLHELANWTQGCIALTDAQVDRLRRYVAIGTPVLIR